MKTFLLLPSQEELHELFEYKEGNLYWKIKPRNSAKIGDKVGSLDSKGYVVLKLNNLPYKMHRIIWAYHYDTISSNLQIDHIDGNKENNHISNLELVSHAENLEHARKTGLIDRERVSPLTAEQVKEIKKLRPYFYSIREIYIVVHFIHPS